MSSAVENQGKTLGKKGAFNAYCRLWFPSQLATGSRGPVKNFEGAPPEPVLLGVGSFWWLPSAEIVTKVQLPYLYFRNLDSAPFGGRLRVGALGVFVSLTPLQGEVNCSLPWKCLPGGPGNGLALLHS